MGKTVAIIVGVLAGVAILIVFLSICRRAMGKIISKNSPYFYSHFNYIRYWLLNDSFFSAD